MHPEPDAVNLHAVRERLFSMQAPQNTQDTGINTLVDNITLEQLDYSANPRGERYFVVKTTRGVCVSNYQPSQDNYVGGPFLTWGGAYTCVDVYRQQRRKQYLSAALLGSALIALFVVLQQ